MTTTRVPKWTEVGAGLLALLLALVALHPEIALEGKVYSSSDAEAAAAFAATSRAAAQAGELPLWNPFVFAGMPSYASLAHNPDTYPLERPIRWLRRGLGTVPMTWLLVHLFLAGAFTAGWLRWRGQDAAVAWVGGVLVMALPNLVAWSAYGHGTKVGTFAWMPLALWATEALARRASVSWAATLAIALSMQLLRAHVQILYYTLMAIAVIAAFHLLPMLRAATTRRAGLARAGWLVAAGAVALLASLSLYLPVLEYQAHSVRGAASQGGGAAFEYATNWSLSWAELPTLWWPTAAGYGRSAYVGGMPFTDYPNYVGLPVLLLAGLGVAFRRDRTTWALVSLVLLTTAVALGKHFFLYQVLYELLPGFKKFRVPVMIVALQQLCLVVLAMQGLSATTRALARGTGPRWLGRPALVALVAAGLVMLLLGSLGAESLRESSFERWSAMARSFGRAVPPAEAMAVAADLARADALRLGAILVAAGIAMGALARGRVPRVAVVGLIGLLAWVDLARVDRPMVHPEDHFPRFVRDGDRLGVVPSEPVIQPARVLGEYTSGGELAAWLRERTPRPRVLPIGGLEADNRLAAQEVVSLGGYHAAKLKVYEDVRARLFDPRRPEFGLANLLAAEWLVAPRSIGLESVEALATLGLEIDPAPAHVGADGVAYAIRSARPRARLVGSYELESPGRDTTAEEPASSVLDRVVARLGRDDAPVVLSAEPVPAPATGPARGSVEWIEEGYNHVRWRVRTEAPTLLVVADVWYPAWRARVDGERVPLLRADHALRSVALGAGEHVVEMEYSPARYRAGRAAGWVGTVLVLAGIVAGAAGRRRATESSEGATG